MASLTDIKVKQQPWAAADAFVPDSDLSGLDPYETIKLRAKLATKGGYTPEQASANRTQSLLDLLYASPLGNALSARDAMEGKWQGQQLEAGGDAEGARKAYANAAASLGMAFLPGMGRIGMGRGAENLAKDASSSVRMFAGPMAKTADKAALAQAEKLEAQGAHADYIWKATGWGRGADNKWRFEIPDNTAKLAGENYIGGGITMTSGLDHPGYTAAYGDQPSSWAHIERGKSPAGAYFAEKNLLHKNEIDPARIEVIAGNTDEAKSLNLHELQHHLQEIEDSARGGNPGQFADIWGPRADRVRIPMETKLIAEELGLKEIPWPGDPDYVRLKAAVKQSMEDKSGRPFKFHYVSDGMDDFDWDYGSTMRAPKEQIAEQTRLGLRNLGIDQYERLAGEVEARNVQTRMNMTPQARRATPPWVTEDVPRAQQLIKMLGKE